MEKVKPEVLSPVLPERYPDVLLEKLSNPREQNEGRCQKPLTSTNGVSALRTKHFIL